LLFIQHQYHQQEHAFIENEHVYNVGFLCKRDGTNEMYRKIHEVFIGGGNYRQVIRTFDTDCGKIGIVMMWSFRTFSSMADQGMNIFYSFLS
jgi:hypothetical protein